MCVHVCVKRPLTAAELERTGMGVHREVFQVHGTLCSYCEPGRGKSSTKDENKHRKKQRVQVEEDEEDL